MSAKNVITSADFLNITGVSWWMQMIKKGYTTISPEDMEVSDMTDVDIITVLSQINLYRRDYSFYLDTDKKKEFVRAFFTGLFKKDASKDVCKCVSYVLNCKKLEKVCQIDKLTRTEKKITVLEILYEIFGLAFVIIAIKQLQEQYNFEYNAQPLMYIGYDIDFINYKFNTDYTLTKSRESTLSAAFSAFASFK